MNKLEDAVERAKTEVSIVIQTLTGAVLVGSFLGALAYSFACLLEFLRRNRKGKVEPEGRPTWSQVSCRKCGLNNHIEDECRYDQVCNFCNRHGHEEERCLFKARQIIQQAEGASGDVMTRARPRKQIKIGKQVIYQEGETQVAKPLSEKEKVEIDRLLYDGPQVEGTSDLVASDLMTHLTNSVCVVRNFKHNIRMRGVMLWGRILAVPLHICVGEDPATNILTFHTKTISGLPVKLSEVWFKVFEDYDLLVLELPDKTIPSFPDIRKYFPFESEDVGDIAEGYLLVPEIDSSGLVRTFTRLQARNFETHEDLEYSGANGDTIVVRTAIGYTADTESGYCGALVVRYDSTAPRKLLGVHVAGEKSKGYAVLLSHEFLCRISPPRAQYVCEEFPYGGLQDIDLWFPQNKHIQVLGKVVEKDAVHSPTKTRLKQTEIFEKIYPAITHPARLVSWVDPEGRRHFPNDLAMEKFDVPQIIFPTPVVEAATQAMRSYYLRKFFDPRKYGTNGLLTNEEIVNGDPNNIWLKPINMSTSPGYPYTKFGGKERYLAPGFIDPQVLAFATFREDEAKCGRAIPAILIDTLKDERLPNAKVEQGKTRIFSNCPLDYTLLFRKYFLKFSAFVMEHHLDGDIAVGLNVHGPSWEIFYKSIKARGKHWIAGDYGSWDKRTPLQIALHALEVVEDFYKRFPDYKEEHARVRRVLIEQSYTSMRMRLAPQVCLYRAHQSMPSGIPLTAVENSLVNALLFRVVHALLAIEAGMTLSQAVSSYDKHVRFSAYGDDHVARVTDHHFQFFNMASIQRMFARYGVEYTAPDKSEVMPCELEDEQLTFLKRSFVQRLGRVDAPLPLDRVLDITNWTRAKGVSDKREATEGGLRAVIIELTHHGRAAFKEWYPRILMEASKVGMSVPIYDYDDALAARLTLEEDPFMWQYY